MGLRDAHERHGAADGEVPLDRDESVRLNFWAWIALIGAAIALVVFVRSTTQLLTPAGLFRMSLETYQTNPQLAPFGRDPDFRLAGVSLQTASTALGQCEFRRWRHLGTNVKAYSDSNLFHHWECRSGSTVVRANEMWEPMWAPQASSSLHVGPTNAETSRVLFSAINS